MKENYEGDYFVFDGHDSWLERTEDGSGYGIFFMQMKKGELENISFEGYFGLANVWDVIDYLNEKEIKKIYSFVPGEKKRFGIKRVTEPDQDDDVLEYSKLSNHEKEFFNKSGIEVVILDD